MDSGVVWSQLATNTGTDLDFIEVIYPPHSTSTNDNRMLQHAGSEFGYLIEGELEITVGFEVHTLDAGDAFGFDSSRPHLFANQTDRPARGIWFVRHVTRDCTRPRGLTPCHRAFTIPEHTTSVAMPHRVVLPPVAIPEVTREGPAVHR